MKFKSKKRVDADPEYIEYFDIIEGEYPQLIVRKIDDHLTARLKEENQHIKTWAISNKYANKKIKKRTLHFFYQDVMEE